MKLTGTPSHYGLEHHNLRNMKIVHWNLVAPLLVEHVIHNQEGELSAQGAVIVNTGQHTGRSPNDKFVIKDEVVDHEIWWGKVNQPLSIEKFDQIFGKVCAYLQGKVVYVQDMQAGAHPNHTLPIRIVSEKAYASLFARDLFIRLPTEKVTDHIPQFTLIHTPDFFADPKKDGINSGTFIIINFSKRLVLIGGSSYAGEIKKAIFTVMNYLLPHSKVLPMHCSANVDDNGEVALFFGLSGTGKTTLSSDPDRMLIGDDEHGWGDEGIFNFEGGCYAKTIKLRADLEPLIYAAVGRFGTVLENVVYDPNSRQPDFDDDRLTENTRAAYPLEYIPNHVPAGYSGHPTNIFFLSADAFGVLPPIALLTPEQAMYYFLSGYTSKLAGTEKGLGAEPQVTFSSCFGAPFLPLHPRVYADMLGNKIKQHNVKVWLINTGWTGGAFGVGSRIKLPYTRSMLRSALNGQLSELAMRNEPYFGLNIPAHCPGVPDEVLDPSLTWGDAEAYRTQALKLVEEFERNFRQYSAEVSKAVIQAGPRLPD